MYGRVWIVKLSRLHYAQLPTLSEQTHYMHDLCCPKGALPVPCCTSFAQSHKYATLPIRSAGLSRQLLGHDCEEEKGGGYKKYKKKYKKYEGGGDNHIEGDCAISVPGKCLPKVRMSGQRLKYRVHPCNCFPLVLGQLCRVVQNRKLMQKH